MMVTAIATFPERDRRPTMIGVPAYGYPTEAETMWADLAALRGDTIVVLNPASGPGTAIDPIYVASLEPLRAAGTAIYGYVDVDYGRRSAATVLSEAARYTRWYGPSGIFLDQVPSHPDQVDYLIGLADDLRAQGFRVALNPGQPEFDPILLAHADHIVNFEGSADQYAATRFPGWAANHPSAFWHLVYDVDGRDAMESALKRAARTGAATVFVTDRSMPNPWDGLPHYWEEQVDAVHRDR